MSKPLEDILRAAASSGRLNHVSIAWTDAGWEVAYRGVKTEDHRFATNGDVVCALREALTGRAGEAPPKRKAPRRAAPVDEDLLI